MRDDAPSGVEHQEEPAQGVEDDPGAGGAEVGHRGADILWTRGHSGSGANDPAAARETIWQPPRHTAKSGHERQGSGGAAW